MTVWQVETSGNETLGLFSSEAIAMDSITFSYHERHVRIERHPNGNINDPNDFQVWVLEHTAVCLNPKDMQVVDKLRVHEVPVHSSRSHL